DVEVTGARSVIGGLDKNDILVYPQLTGVTEAGRYDLQLVATKVDSLLDYQISTNGISPRTVSVRFDQIRTKKFVVEVDTTGVQPAQGYILDKAFATPSEITLSGPQKELSAVSKVVVQVDLAGEELSESRLTAGTIALYDRDNNPLSKNLLTLDSENVEVTVPILKKATLPIKVEFAGVPEGLDTSIFKYTLSHTTINVAGPGAKLSEMQNLVIGYINIPKEFKLGGEYSFDVTLDKGFINLDNVTRVTVSFDTGALASKTVTVKDVRLINEPQNYNIRIETPRLYDVTIIGSKEEIASLGASDVIAQINAADITTEKGQQTVPVSILIPGSNTMFAIGSYTALIDISLK
ncbi:MAG: CdaR family protein, partial [Pygmaiobacter sp.]